MTEAQRNELISNQYIEKHDGKNLQACRNSNESCNMTKQFSQKSYKKKHNRLSSKFGVTSFPSISIDTGKGYLKLKGQSCQHRTTQNNFQIADVNSDDASMKIVAQIDREYLMRNFPISYFQNVDLLFKIIGKKKKFIKNTYKTQKRQKSEECEIGLGQFQQRAHSNEQMPTENLFNKEKISKIRESKKQTNKNEPKFQQYNKRLSHKYKQIMTITQHHNPKQLSGNMQKVFSERKLNKIDEKQFSYTQKFRQIADNRNTLHNNVKSAQKFRIKHIDGLVKPTSSEDQFIKKIAMNQLKINKSNEKQTIIPKKSIKLNDYSNIRQNFDKNRKLNIRQKSLQDDKNLNQVELSLLNTGSKSNSNRKSQEVTQKDHYNNKSLNSLHTQSRSEKEKIQRQSQKNALTNENWIQYIHEDDEDKKTIKIGEQQQCQFLFNQKIRKPISIKKRNEQLQIPKKMSMPVVKQVKNSNTVNNANNGKIENRQLNKEQKHNLNEKFKKKQTSPQKNDHIQQSHSGNIKKITRQSKSDERKPYLKKKIFGGLMQDNQKRMRHDNQKVENQIEGEEDLLSTISKHNQNSSYKKDIKTGKVQYLRQDLALGQQKHESKARIQKISQIQIISGIPTIMTKEQLQAKDKKNKDKSSLTMQDNPIINNADLENQIEIDEAEDLKKTPHFNFKQVSKPKTYPTASPKSSKLRHNIQDRVIQTFSPKITDLSPTQKIEKDALLQSFSPIVSNKNLYEQNRYYLKNKPLESADKSFSNIDSQQINDFYDEIVELGANQHSQYRPKLGRLSNINVQQIQELRKMGLIAIKNEKNEPQHQERSNIKIQQSLHSIDKAIMGYTQSDSMINSPDQTLIAPSMNKKTSSKISIFSSSSQPQRQATKRKKPTTIIQQQQENMYQSKSPNLNDSLICIDLNQKVQTPLAEFKFSKKSSESLKKTNKESSKKASTHGYQISVNQIQQYPAKINQKQPSPHERSSQASACINIPLDAKISHQSSMIQSEVSLLNMDAELQEEINKHLELMKRDSADDQYIQEQQSNSQQSSESKLNEQQQLYEQQEEMEVPKHEAYQMEDKINTDKQFQQEQMIKSRGSQSMINNKEKDEKQLILMKKSKSMKRLEASLKNVLEVQQEKTYEEQNYNNDIMQERQWELQNQIKNKKIEVRKIDKKLEKKSKEINKERKIIENIQKTKKDNKVDKNRKRKQGKEKRVRKKQNQEQIEQQQVKKQMIVEKQVNIAKNEANVESKKVLTSNQSQGESKKALFAHQQEEMTKNEANVESKKVLTSNQSQGESKKALFAHQQEEMTKNEANVESKKVLTSNQSQGESKKALFAHQQEEMTKNEANVESKKVLTSNQSQGESKKALFAHQQEEMTKNEANVESKKVLTSNQSQGESKKALFAHQQEEMTKNEANVESKKVLTSNQSQGESKKALFAHQQEEMTKNEANVESKKVLTSNQSQGESKKALFAHQQEEMTKNEANVESKKVLTSNQSQGESKKALFAHQQEEMTKNEANVESKKVLTSNQSQGESKKALFAHQQEEMTKNEANVESKKVLTSNQSQGESKKALFAHQQEEMTKNEANVESKKVLTSNQSQGESKKALFAHQQEEMTKNEANVESKKVLTSNQSQGESKKALFAHQQEEMTKNEANVESKKVLTSNQVLSYPLSSFQAYFPQSSATFHEPSQLIHQINSPLQNSNTLARHNNNNFHKMYQINIINQLSSPIHSQQLQYSHLKPNCQANIVPISQNTHQDHSHQSNFHKFSSKQRVSSNFKHQPSQQNNQQAYQVDKNEDNTDEYNYLSKKSSHSSNIQTIIDENAKPPIKFQPQHNSIKISNSGLAQKQFYIEKKNTQKIVTQSNNLQSSINKDQKKVLSKNDLKLHGKFDLKDQQIKGQAQKHEKLQIIDRSKDKQLPNTVDQLNQNERIDKESRIVTNSPNQLQLNQQNSSNIVTKQNEPSFSETSKQNLGPISNTFGSNRQQHPQLEIYKPFANKKPISSSNAQIKQPERSLDKLSKQEPCVFQKKKQVICCLQEEYIYSDESQKTQNHSQKLIGLVHAQNNLDKIQGIQQEDPSKNQTQKVKLFLQDPSTKTMKNENIEHNTREISTNTFDLLGNCQENGELQIEKLPIAGISNYLLNYDENITTLPKNSKFQFNEQLWNIALKIFNFLNMSNNFLDRLVDDQSVWLFNCFQKISKFQRISLPFPLMQLKEQQVKEGLKFLLSMISLEAKIDLNNIKFLIEALTGMPVLLLKQTCYHKLDNLYRHNNIFGFTYGKEEVWRIVGTLQNKKNPQQKRLRLEKISNKEIIEITWKKFLDQFKHSFIAGFSDKYHLRSLRITSNSKSKEQNPSFKLIIKDKNKSGSKIHCIMGATSINEHQKELNGKMLVYGKTQTEKKGQQCYKYLGSGDIGLVSMKLRQGEYIIVLELEEKSKHFDLEISMGSESKQVILEHEKS